MKPNIQVLFTFVCLLIWTAPNALGGTEQVTVIKVMRDDDKGIVQRSNGEKWMIEKGVGAISFWRYDGKSVLIYSPGLFGGVGSKLILPADDQEARIWNAERISEDTTPVEPVRAVETGVSKEQTVGAITRSLVFLGYLNPDSPEKDQSDALRALNRFRVACGVSETNKIGSKTLSKLAENVLKERGDSAEGLELAQTLIASALQMTNRTQPPPSSIPRAGFQRERFIVSVTSNGTVVKLDDGSIYEVDDLDQIRTMLWLPSDKVLKKSNGLINLRSGESVTAEELK